MVNPKGEFPPSTRFPESGSVFNSYCGVHVPMLSALREHHDAPCHGPNIFSTQKRGPMKSRLQAAAALVMAASLVVSYAQSTDSASTAKKHHAVRKERK